MFYIKIQDIVFEVNGTRAVPKTWQVSCEHTSFKGLCLKCIDLFIGIVDNKKTGRSYLKNWGKIQFLN